MTLPIDKYCPKCDETKPSADFHPSKSERDGLQWACKECVKQMSKLADEKKLAYKPFSLLLQQVVMKNDGRKLLQLVNKVYETSYLAILWHCCELIISCSLEDSSGTTQSPSR